MIKTFSTLLLVIGLAIQEGPEIWSQSVSGNMGLLVSTKWLEEHLKDSLVVVLQFGDRSDFEKGHIPGARFISLKEIMVDRDSGLRHELPDGEDIQKVLRSWGINHNAKIVICYENERSIPMASRLFFTLDYAGLGQQAGILNGGLTAWIKEDRTLSKDGAVYDEGNFSIETNNEVLVHKDDVQASLHNELVSIVDARPEKQYSGSAKDHNSDRKGHIAGAINIPFDMVTEADAPYLFRTEQDLAQLFQDKNIEPGSTIIVYCGSGIWASPVYFAARMLGYEVLFYDGSFQEWGNDPLMPVGRTN